MREFNMAKPRIESLLEVLVSIACIFCMCFASGCSNSNDEKQALKAATAEKPGSGVQRLYHRLHDSDGCFWAHADFLGIGFHRLGSHVLTAEPGKRPLVWHRRGGPGHHGSHTGRR